MKVALVGKGVVGNALYESFTKREIDVVIYDKYKDIGNIEDILDVEFIFMCLPTLYNETIGEYDKTSVDEICKYLNKKKYEGLVIIKSTVEPETCEFFSRLYGLNICHNPEFLSAKTAIEDFDNQNHIVIGTTTNCDKLLYDKLNDFYKHYYPNIDITLCTSNESELMKIGVNNFYSVKVMFFNELYLLSKKMAYTDYKKVREMMIKNGWINEMHTQVPGTDGKLGYGGMCFPKDTNALLQYMIRKDSPNLLLKGCVEENKIIRDM